MTTISIITPWLNHSELCPLFESNVKGCDQAIVIDNGSDGLHAPRIEEMFLRLKGAYLRNDFNNGFGKANNQGLALAVSDIVIFMNNDVECQPGWLDKVRRDVKPGGLYGQNKTSRYGSEYIEGFCIAATLTTWKAVGGWPELAGLYWEDNLLCLKALRMGYTLHQCNWGVWHFNNFTSRDTPGAYDYSKENEQLFLKMLGDKNAR